MQTWHEEVNNQILIESFTIVAIDWIQRKFVVNVKIEPMCHICEMIFKMLFDISLQIVGCQSMKFDTPDGRHH